MRRKSFSGWLRRCYLNVCLKSRQSKIALSAAILFFFLGVAGIHEDHREVESAPQQTPSLASPLSASGNVTASYVHSGWWGNQLVMSDLPDLFGTQRAARDVTLRVKS